MTHEKLVAGTESPTRYTKIIRNPGAGTKYNRTYQETGYVSRYTKTAAPGISYTPPAPPEPEYEPLVVDSKATWSDGNVYAIGSTISGVSATYNGGSDSTVYRSRTQHRPASNDAWINSGWTPHTNTPQVISFTIPDGAENGQVRFQTQARDDSVDPVNQVNSFASVQAIDPLPTSIGTVSLTVDDVAHTYGDVIHCVVNQSLRFHMSADGDASPTYKWESRGDYPMLISEQAASTILTFPEFGNVTLTCTILDGNATDSPITYAMSVYVATEAEWEVTNPSTKTTKSSSNPNNYFLIYGVRRTDS